jgi:PilZ domain
MLELDHDQKLIDDQWEATSARVELSESMRREFFTAHGVGPILYDNRRSFHRHFMRGKAVLKRGETMLGAYTKDVSRKGVAFLSPVPLLPKERVKLRMPSAELSLEVTRCRRLEPACFECGARFAL